MKRPFFSPGSRQQIYQDPLTRQKPEGSARLVKCTRDSSQFDYSDSHGLVAEEWDVRFEGEDGLTVICDETGFAICSEWHFLSESSKANARLIAAAPELLEALENLLGCGAIQGMANDHPDILAARAAIAKAK